jgi:hypothetical protein
MSNIFTPPSIFFKSTKLFKLVMGTILLLCFEHAVNIFLQTHVSLYLGPKAEGALSPLSS